jgi:hypothetical protein
MPIERSEMLSLASTQRAVAAALILGLFVAAPAVADDAAPAKADAMPAPTSDAPPPKDNAAPAMASDATLAYRRAVHSPLCRATGWVSGECW